MARELSEAAAAGLAVIPRGGGTKSDWGNPPERADVVLSTRRLSRVVEHAAGDLTVTVEAGCTIRELQRTVAERNQRLATDPLWPDRATVGGVLATNDNGSLRHAYGSLRDLVIGMTIALPDGTLARSGGKVVKNVAGYDLPKLMVGSFGTLGVITEATFRLHPLPKAVRALAFSPPSLEAAARLMLAVQDSTLATTGVQLIAGRSAPPLVLVRLEGSGEAVDAQARRLGVIARDSGAGAADEADPQWDDAEPLWEAGGGTAVCKVTALPSRWRNVGDVIARVFGHGGDTWRLVAQAAGAGWLGVSPADEQGLTDDLLSLRAEVVTLGGTLAVIRSPPEVKRRVDAWGDVGDALPLMRRVKQQFDPDGILNPRRFVGGI